MNKIRIRSDIQVGMIAEDCTVHIGEVTYCDPIKGDVRIKSIFDGIERTCDLYHCGVVTQTPEDIKLKQHLFTQGGTDAIAKHYWSQIDEEYRPEEFK